MTRNTPHTGYAMSGRDMEIVDLTMDDVEPPAPGPARRANINPNELAAELAQIIIIDDDDNDIVPTTEDPIDYINDFENDEPHDPDEDFRQFTAEEWADVARAARATGTPGAYELVTVTTWCGIKVTVGMCVELRNGDFLFVKSLGPDYAKGIQLRRTRYAKDLLEKKTNELYAILLTRAGAKDPVIDACLVSRSLHEIIAVRRLIFTNYLFPNLRYCDQGESYDPTEDAAETGLLVCRWKCIESYDDQRRQVVRSPILIRLNEDECTKGKAMSSGLLRQQVRDIRLGSIQAQGIAQPFTFGDLCTGAGGVARGADQSGLKLMFFLDHWEPACVTLDANWPRVNVLLMSINEFLTKGVPFDAVVDILHISFPCQPHSLAHTCDGKDDEQNIATAYSVGEILRKCRPRVVTFEQTSGIIHRGGYHYRALIHQLTACSYNVRARIIKCDAYGNAQARERLIIIASCPGEALPPFPEETHGLARGLKTPTTIRDRLRVLRHHNIPPHMRVARNKPGRPYDPNQPLRQCITTDGGKGDLHPHGNRTFTLAELASLAGFPPEHQFCGTKTDIKKQIGNAVPACVAKALFDQIKKTMTATDQAIAAASASAIEVD